MLFNFSLIAQSDSFFQGYEEPFREDPDWVALYIGINSFEDPAPLSDGLGILFVLLLFYLLIKRFKTKVQWKDYFFISLIKFYKLIDFSFSPSKE